MKKYLGVLSIFLGIGGIGMLFLAGMLKLNIIVTIGFVMIIVGIAGALVSNAIEESHDITSWNTKGLQKPTADKGQLPLGGYTSSDGQTW